MLQVDLGVIGKIFVVPIENRTYHRRFVWASKNIVEIVLEGIVLGKDIAPNLQKIRKDSLGQFTDASIYEDTAIAFIVFFALQIILDLMVWTFVVWTNGYDTSVAISVLLSVVSDMPIIICGVCLMKYNGIIDWRNQPMFELIFQRWFIFNIMLQITAGYAKKVRFILGPLSYLVACLPYAFVIISMSAEWYFCIQVFSARKSRDFPLQRFLCLPSKHHIMSSSPYLATNGISPISHVTMSPLTKLSLKSRVNVLNKTVGNAVLVQLKLCS
ncbi:hypothetical protein AC249_AIPGENE21471 [Exaiptasia diaphana]|nr:hypothetical protein AC249_AIPGENE21471 [Exaiptasia diaphana]